jgi:hypothetical protein
MHKWDIMVNADTQVAGALADREADWDDDYDLLNDPTISGNGVDCKNHPILRLIACQRNYGLRTLLP